MRNARTRAEQAFWGGGLGRGSFAGARSKAAVGAAYVSAAVKGLTAMLVLVAVAGLMVVPAWAQGVEGGGEQAYLLSLAEAVQRAMERAPEVTLARLAVTEAELALQEAELGALVGRPRSEYDEAVLALQQARDEYLGALAQVALQVEEAYYAVLRAAELLAIQASSQEQSDRQFALTRARYEAGHIARQDFLEAEANHAGGVERLEQARRSHAEAMRRLALLVGLPENAMLTLTEEVALEEWQLPLEEALEEALAQRAEIARARRTLARAESALAQASSPYAAPVERVRAELQLERARVQYEQAVATVSAQVRQEWFSLVDAQRNVATTRRQEELALGRAEIARVRYEAGAIALLDWLQAESSYAQARLNAAAAVWDYNLAKARFLRTLGRTELPPLPDSIAEYIASWDEGR